MSLRGRSKNFTEGGLDPGGPKMDYFHVPKKKIQALSETKKRQTRCKRLTGTRGREGAYCSYPGIRLSPRKYSRGGEKSHPPPRDFLSSLLGEGEKKGETPTGHRRSQKLSLRPMTGRVEGGGSQSATSNPETRLMRGETSQQIGTGNSKSKYNYIHKKDQKEIERIQRENFFSETVHTTGKKKEPGTMLWKNGTFLIRTGIL